MAANSAKKTSRQDWDWDDVVHALHKKQITLKALAEAHGLKSGSTMAHTGKRSYPANEKRIADALGLHPKDIWPSRYYEDGTRRPQGLRGRKFTLANAPQIPASGHDE